MAAVAEVPAVMDGATASVEDAEPSSPGTAADEVADGADASAIRKETEKAAAGAGSGEVAAKAAGDGGAEEDEMLRSAYQVAREANIRRNLEELRALGLIGDDDESAGGAASDGEGSSERAGKKKTKSSSAAKKRAATRAPAEPMRKSRRLQRQAPEHVPEGDLPCLPSARDSDGEDDETAPERAYRITMERKIARLKALHEERATAYKNPTATYEHTWKRVRTMTDQALATRIKVIERACGQHCIVKMRMFAEVLIIANKAELAAEATAALGRLRKLAKA